MNRIKIVSPGTFSVQAAADSDGIHPHLLGYEIMAEVLSKTLALNGIELNKV